jgi:hypothetical protein
MCKIRLIGAKLPRQHIELLLKSLNLFLGHPSAKEKMLKSVSAIFFISSPLTLIAIASLAVILLIYSRNIIRQKLFAAMSLL